MRRRDGDETAGQPCPECARRAWLLGELGTPLDYCARNSDRLLAALALDDEPLIGALGGRRSQELLKGWKERAAGPRGDGDGEPGACRHHPRYPSSLRADVAPRALHLAPDAGRLASLGSAPVVAVVGSERASDYGIAVANALARGLAASGVTVAGMLADGIAQAAHAGAHEVGGASVAVLGGGLRARRPPRLRALLARIVRAGCAVSELPAHSPARRWAALASRRTLAMLAEVTVLVEGPQRPAELVAVRCAHALGRRVAAVPGRVTSPLAAAPNALIAAGEASVARGAGDVLELLGLPCEPRRAQGDPPRALEPRLQATLAEVASGRDTPQQLIGRGSDVAETLLCLSELELMGLLARGAAALRAAGVLAAVMRLDPARGAEYARHAG